METIGLIFVIIFGIIVPTSFLIIFLHELREKDLLKCSDLFLY